MVNKTALSGRMEIISILLLWVFLPGGASAQNLTKYYVSSRQPAGILYHILPQVNFMNPGTKTELKMDVTYLDSRDSATVNFTYSDPESMLLKQIAISHQQWKYQSPVERIYIETNKSLWIYRYTFAIPCRQLELFYKSKDPEITLITDSGSINLKVIKKQWEKNSDASSLILQMIEKNK